MFHFPAFPPHALCVQAWVTGFKALPGFPIRKSSDHSSVDSSPRHIAASHVLHRLLVPRHPPCALTNLATKMLASTVQFSTYGRPQPTRQNPPPHGKQSPTTTGPFTSRPPPQPPEGDQQKGSHQTRKPHSLRTQQRATHHQPPTRPVPPAQPPRREATRSTRHPADNQKHYRQRSTHEQPDRHAHPALALNQPTPNRTDQPDAP